jgi:hypothetical protein
VHKVEFVRLSEVVGADRNAKLHSTGDLKASIRRFGFVAPLLKNAINGKLVAGHGRTEALRELKRDGQPRPARIEVAPDGEWLVPVIAVPFATKADEEAYILSDNRQVELAGYDSGILSSMLADLRDADALAGTGFSDKQVDALLKAAAKDAPTLAEGFTDEADATMEALDGEDDDVRTLVLTVEADEYQSFVSRLQAVMRACKGASWTDAVKALLDRWEAESDG